MTIRQEGIRRANFVFALGPEGARCGTYIECNRDEVNGDWDWRRFISGLRREASELRQISTVMREHGVTAQPYLSEGDEEGPPTGQLDAGPEGLTWRPTGGGAVDTSWPDFAELLSQLDPILWCDLYFQAKMSKGEAIELGVDIADRVVNTFVGLLPLYTLSLR